MKRALSIPVGGTYVDPRNKKLTQEETNFIKSLPAEKKKIFDKMTPAQRASWVKGKMADQPKGGRAMGYSPLNLYLEDDAGRISGFPGGDPACEIPNTAIRRLMLSDGTYWTELEYPLDASYRLVVEGTGGGEADLLLGFDGQDERSTYRYSLQSREGMLLEVQTGSGGSTIYTESGPIGPEEIFEAEQEWLDSKPDVVAPQELEVTTDQEEAGLGDATPSVIPDGQASPILDNWNIGAVDNGPSCSPTFTISVPHRITYVDTYHWNYGQGTVAGGYISLEKEDGTVYGPWVVQGEPGMNGVPNAWWKCRPDAVIPAGTYTVVDSDPSTWSHNYESGGCGFSRVEGYPEDGRACDWTGTWSTNWGEMVLQQSGDDVSGHYAHDQGRIQGTVSGGRLVGTW
ncbi:MAG: hypothetical protein QUS08_08740, partial [Methanothrix sp.]|nr:hypothetical protein [Methanothrix sp.]